MSFANMQINNVIINQNQYNFVFKTFVIACIILNYFLMCVDTATKNSLCGDLKQNLVTGDSYANEPLEVMIYNFAGVLYKSNGKDFSCYNGRPTIVMPGYTKLLQGKLIVPKKYDLIKSGIIKMTVRNPRFDDPLCLNGESQYLAFPNSFCKFELCSGFIGNELCEFLSTPGTHTIQEMERKLKFNSTLELPEPPSLLGISILDFFSGEFSFDFALEYEGKTILKFQLPSNEKYLQIGLYDSSEDDNNNDDFNEKEISNQSKQSQQSNSSLQTTNYTNNKTSVRKY